jgi:uncharacterized protein (DUF885 family)
MVADDPGVALAGERRAIERLARAAAALSLHLGGTGDETALVAERAGLPPQTAASAVAAARSDPVAAIAPALGLWRILDLRAECRAKMGHKFSQRRFHEALLVQGAVPLPLARGGVLRALGFSERPR